MQTAQKTSTEIRKERGALLAARMRIVTKKPGLFIVPASSGSGSYIVEDDQQTQSCTCPDFELRREPCKHVYAVQYARSKEVRTDGTTVTTESLRITYAQPSWPAYHSAQCHEKEHVIDLLRSLCDGVPSEPQVGRGERRLPLSDQIFAIVMKVYGGMSTRRTDTDMRGYAEKDLMQWAPSFNSVIRYMDNPALASILTSLIEESAAPLATIETTFAPDATGFSTCTYERWLDAKYGKEQSKQRYLKAHMMVGVRTNIITAIKITDSNMNDAPELPALLATTRETFNVKEVVADKGYLSNANQLAIMEGGADCFIPFKSNSTPDMRSHRHHVAPELWKKLFHFFSFKNAEFRARYHARSNAEASFSSMKRKLGVALRSKTRVAQENEVLCKVLAYNLTMLVHEMYELGLRPEFWRVSPMSAPLEMIELPAATGDMLELP